jgi:hypothetical protein
MSIKRKKTILLVSIVACFTIGIIAWQFTKPSSADPPHLEKFLPARTVGFVQAHDLRAQALKIADSEAWQALLAENPTASPLFLMGANHSGILDASYALALLGVEFQRELPLPQAVLVANFTSGQALRIFEHRLLERKKASVKSRVRYQEVEILLWEGKEASPGPSLGYFKLQNRLALSNSIAALREVIDVLQGKAPSLSANPKLMEARRRASHHDEMFGFIDGEAWGKLLAGLPRQGKTKLLHLFSQGMGMNTVEYGSMTSAFAEGYVVENFVVRISRTENGLIRTLQGNPPTQGLLLELVPENILQLFDVSVANAADVFDQLRSLVSEMGGQENKNEIDDWLAAFREKTSLDFRNEIIESIGAEICLFQLPGPGQGQGAILLNLQDPQRFQLTLEKLTAKLRISSTPITVGGQVFRQLEDKGHKLVFGLVRDNLVLSPGTSALESMLSTLKSGRSLAASPAYAKARNAATEPPLFIYYGSNQDYLNSLGKILHRQNKDFRPTEQESHLQPSIALGYSKADGFHVESHSPLGTFPRLLMLVTSRLMEEINAETPPHP